MVFSICLIEDAIPIEAVEGFDHKERLNSSCLNFLINNQGISWREDAVKNLVAELIKLKDTQEVSAFTNPAFYFTAFERERYTPDIVILDWDFGIKAEETEDYLIQILEKTFCYVNIFTGVDQKREIETLLAADKYKPYFNERIGIIHKEDDDAINKVLETVKQKTDNNFSLKFGNILRGETSKSLEQVLVSLGRIPLNDLIRLLGEKKENESILSPDCLVELIVEKLRNDLNARHFGDKQKVTLTDMQPVASDIAAMFWAYRLYYKPSDSIIRRGDIVFETANKANKYLVISADCNLRRFWKNQYGFLNMVPIVEVNNEQGLKDKLSFAKKLSNIDFKFSSFTNKSNDLPEGVFLLPFIEDEGYKNYLLFSRELSSKEIKPDPARVSTGDGKEKKNADLRIEYGTNNPYTRLCTISEPFLSPLITKILETVSGIGVPDYSDIVKNELSKKCKENFQDQA